MLFTMLCKMALTLKCEQGTLVRDHSSESYLRAVLSCGAVCFSIEVEISFLNHCLC